MTQPAQPNVGTKTPLDAAQTIVAELQGMPEPDQSLALKFAAETLRIDLHVSHTTPAAPMVTPPAGGPTGQPKNIRSFTTEKAPKSDQQFAAVVAYFYQFEAGTADRKDTIDANTMKEAARQAKRSQVSDWNMTLHNAKNSGFLDAAARGEFKLNAVGENLVAMTLPGNGTSNVSTAGRTKKKVAKNKAASKKTAKRGG